MKIPLSPPSLEALPKEPPLNSPAPPGPSSTGFKELLQEVNQSQSQADNKISKTLLGQEDIHEAILALEKAGLSFKLLIQVSNKMIQAYEELNRMPV